MSGRSRCAFVAAILAVGCLSLLSSASAAVVIWTGSTVDLNWATAGNWGVSGVPLADSDVILPTPIPNPSSTWPNPESISLDTGSLANSLTARDSYTLSNGNLTVTSGAITVATGSTLTISSALTGSGGLILAANNGLAGGDAQTGGGTLVLNWTNTYAGDTVIEAGTLAVNSDANLGNSSAATAITFAAGGTGRLQITQTGFSSYKGITLTGDGDVNILNAGDTATLGGVITGAGKFTKSGAGILVLSGTNTNSGVVSITGGTLSISAGNNLGNAAATNTLAIAGGTLQWTGGTSESLGATRTLSIGSGGATVDATGAGTLTIDGVISGSDNLTKTGAGILALTADNSAYAGNIIVNGGVLRSSTTVINSLGTGNLQITSGVHGYGGAFTRALGAGAGQVQVTGGVSGFGAGGFADGSVNLGGAGAEVQWGGATFNPSVLLLNDASTTYALTFENALDLSSATNRTIQVDSTGVATMSGIIRNTGGAGGLVKAGSGTLSLTGTNTYGGGTTLSAGTLRVGNDSALGTGALTFSAATTLAASDGTARALANNLVLNADATFGQAAGGTGALTLSGTVDLGGGAPRTLTVVNATTLSGVVSNGALTKAGSGTLTLSGNNTFDGTVNVTAGELIVGSNTALGSTVGATSVNSGARIVLGNGVNVAGETVTTAGDGINFIGGLQTAVDAVATWSGPVKLGAGARLGGAGAGQLTVSGAISDDAGSSLIISATPGTSTGVVILSGANNYTGTTSIVRGTLKLGAANSLPATTVLDVHSGGTPDAAAFDLNGFNQTIAALQRTDGGGTSTVTNSGAAATLTVNQAINTTYSGVMSGALNLVKQGAGTLTLSTASTRTGTTLISGGRIAVTNSTAAGPGAVTVDGATSVYEINTGAVALAQDVTVNNGGTFQWMQNAQLTMTPKKISFTGTGGTLYVGGSGASGKVLAATDLLSSSAGSLVTKTGGGVLQLSGADSGFLGNLEIQAGTVEFQNVDSLGTTAKTVNIIGTGEFATSGVTNRNNVTLGGGTLSANNSAAIYSGAINVTGASKIAMRSFNATNTGNSFAISGPISGAGALNISSSTDNDAVTLTLSGNNSTYSGNITANAGVTLLFNTLASRGTGAFTLNGGSLNFASPSPTATSAPAGLGTAGVSAFYGNFASNIGVTSNAFTTDQIYLRSRIFTQTDALMNVPNPAASATYPIVPVPGFQIGNAGATNEGIMWRGVLNVGTTGNYQFSGTNDDNLQLWIDGVSVGTIGVVSANANIGSAVALTAGYHNIMVRHTQGAGSGYATVSYNGPDTSSQTVLVGSVQLGGTTPTLYNGAVLDNLSAITLAGGTNNVTIIADSTTPSLNSTAAATLNLASSFSSTLTVTGDSTFAGGATTTLNPNTAFLIVNGAIGQSAAGAAVTLNGTARTTFLGGTTGNTYTGLTTVSAGQLVLDSANGVAINGDLTINANNTTAPIANVQLNRANQIVDTATVTLSNSAVLNLGAFNETVGTLAVAGRAQVLGTGTISASAFNLTGGLVAANLGGAGSITVASGNTVTLAGSNNTYTGANTIQAGGTLSIRNGTLGSAVAGTTVDAGGQLELATSFTSAEAISIAGAGISASDPGAIRVFGGNVALTSALTLTDDATVRIEAGQLILNQAPVIPGGKALTMQGAGTLVFGYDTAGVIPVTHTSGVIGFAGTQTGVFTAPVAIDKAYRFNSDPTAAATINAPAGSTVVAGYAVDQNLLSRFGADVNAAGALALAVDSANNLDFTAGGGRDLSLGASGNVAYSGVITPNAATYRLGGAGLGGSLQNRLVITQPLTGANALVVSGGEVNLSYAANTFSGNISVDGKGALSYTSNRNLGELSTPGNTINLSNGGTFRLAFTSGVATSVFPMLGQTVNGTGGSSNTRSIAIGAGGGVIDVPAQGFGNNLMAVNGVLSGGFTLTKTGLGYVSLQQPGTFAGDLVIDSAGGIFDLRAAGSLASVNSITINQGGRLDVNNENGLMPTRNTGPGAQYVANRVNDSAPITLNGGGVYFRPRTGAANVAETFGPLTVNAGQAQISADSNVASSSGGVMTFGVLTRNTGGTIRFGGSAGTYGAGTAGAPGANNTQVTFSGMATTTLLPWGTTYGNDLIAYGANGIVNASYTAQAVGATFTPAAANIYNIANNGTATLAAASALEMLGLRFGVGDNNTTLAFSTTTDVLYLGGGAISVPDINLGTDNTTRTISLGGNAVRGRVTAGVVGSTVAQELFIHANNRVNQGTNRNMYFDIQSLIVDNPGGGVVSVVKDLAGTVNVAIPISRASTTVLNSKTVTVSSTSDLMVGQLVTGTGIPAGATIASITDATHYELSIAATAAGSPTAIYHFANTYSGGTYLTAGRMNVQSMGGLGTGAVTVKNATLQLNFPGAVSVGGSTLAADPIYTAKDVSELYLQNTTGAYNTATNRFLIEAGSVITAEADAAAAGLNSLTRIADSANFTAGGQIKLKTGAVVRATTVAAAPNDIGVTNMIQGLGASADLYFNTSATLSEAHYLTIGAGTPWRGLASSRTGATFNAGTLIANSDFELVGNYFDTSMGTVTLGATGDGASYSIVNAAGQPINAIVRGGLALSEDSVVSMPSNLTFVVTNGAVVQPNRSGSFGSGTNVAKVLVQAGGTVDPGDYAKFGAAANQAPGAIYPVAGPLNASEMIFEAGARLLANDASGIGPSPVGSLKFRTGSVIQLGYQYALVGINAAQFDLEPGVIVRQDQSGTSGVISDVTNFDVLQSAANGERMVLVMYNGNRGMTLVRDLATGAQTQIQNITFADGGGVTNDAVDSRQFLGGGYSGHTILKNGAFLAGTTGTYLNYMDDIEIPTGAVVNIGNTGYIDGLPKLGGVQLGASNSSKLAGSFNILPGAQLSLMGTNVLPDTFALDLPSAPTNLATGGILPGTGSSLLLNTAVAEVMGALTGNGAVIANTSAAALHVGYGGANFTFNGVFSSGGAIQVSVGKLGAGNMTLTGQSTSTGNFYAYNGTTTFSGSGSAAFATYYLQGGTIVLDNSATALNNRLGGTAKALTFPGGNFKLVGHATDAVTEAVGTLQLSTIGGKSTITVDPTAGGATTLSFNDFTNSYTSGTGATFIMRGPGLGGTPATRNIDGTVTANPAANGLIVTAVPRMWSTSTNSGTNPNSIAGINGGGQVIGSAGTALAMVRVDTLGDTSLTGSGTGFVTMDTTTSGLRILAASEYNAYIQPNYTSPANVKLSGGTVNVAGGDDRIQTLTFAGATTLNVGATIPFTNNPSRLRVSTGGILAAFGVSTINAPYLTNYGVDTAHYFWTTGGDLTINAKLVGNNGWIKSGAGTLTFGAGALALQTGNITINEGSVVLSGANPLYVSPPGAANAFNFTGRRLNLNSGTFDLGGNSQILGDLYSFGDVNGNNSTSELAGGTLTSATAATVTVQANAGDNKFAGNISGAISLVKAGPNGTNRALTLTAANDYSGDTFVRSGTLRLRDGGRLVNSSVINVYQSTLEFDNTGLGNLSNRVKANAVVNLYASSVLNLVGSRDAAAQTIGTLALKTGGHNINVGAGQSTSAELTIGNLTRDTGSIAFFNASAFSGNTATGGGTLGNPGSTFTNPRILLNQINGGAVTLNDGILGGWATIGGADFASYNSNGVGAIGNTFGGFPAYTTTDINGAAATATANVDSTANSDSNVTVTLGASKTINSLRIGNFSTGGNSQYTLVMGANNLTIDTGGWLSANNGKNVTVSSTGGTITSGGPELFFTVNQGTTTIGAPIVDNGGAVNLVKTGGGTLLLTGDNTFTGKTYVDNGTLRLTRTNAGPAVLGDIDINGGTLHIGKSDQIADNATITINGGGQFGGSAAGFSDTFRRVILNGVGGSTSQVSFGGSNALTLTLTDPVPITVVNDNITKEIAGNGVLTVIFAPSTGTTSAIDVSGSSPFGIVFNSTIASVPSGGLVKTGPGLMTMNPSANNFGAPASPTEVFHISGGIVRVDNAASLGVANAITTIEPAGTLLGGFGVTYPASLKLNGGVLSATMGNAVFSGNVDVAAASTILAREYYRDGIARFVTVSGVLSGSGNLSLLGTDSPDPGQAGVLNVQGGLILSNTSNTYSGTITVNNGAQLRNQPATSGLTLGTATVNLAGGQLELKSDAGQTFANVVNLTAPSTIYVDRVSGTSGTPTVQTLSTLNVIGEQALNIAQGNSYTFSIGTLGGAGTLVKRGQVSTTIGAMAVDGSGNATTGFGIAGAPNLGVAHTFNTTGSANVTFTAASNKFTTFKVGGFYVTPASKTFDVSGEFAVESNPGNLPGALAVTDTTTINTSTFRNDGQVGSRVGTATITATAGFTGSGHYVTSGQQLNLAGNVTAGDLCVAGNNVVAVTGANNNTPASVQVQSGTLRIAPTAATTSPLGSGPVSVFGSPALSAATDGVPVNAVSAILDLAAGAYSITHSGNIANSGTVRVSSGAVTVSGAIAGTTLGYVPGLLEGFTTAAWDTTNARTANPGNFGVRLEPRMGQTNAVTGNQLTGHLDNDHWIYTGYVKDDDGVFSFVENIDDNVGVWIDGVARLLANNGGTSRAVSTAYSVGQATTAVTAGANTGTPSQNFGAGITIPGYGDGWHKIEIRFRNGTGSAGPNIGNGFNANYGFGYKNGIGALDGADYVKPIDNGTGNLFVTPVGGKGNVQVDAGATLNVQQVAMTNRMILAASATGATVNLNHTSAAASAVDNLEVTGTTGTATLTTNANTSLTVGNFSGGNGTTLAHSGPTNRLVITGNAAGGTINSTGAAGVTFNSAAAQAASSVIAGNGGLLKQGDGVLTVSGANTYGGDTAINAGTLRLAGTTAPVAGAALWLDGADVLNTGANPAAGASVTTWVNKGTIGVALNAVQNGANPVPTIGGTLNGHDVVNFVRTSDSVFQFLEMNNAAVATLANNPYTAVIVARATAGNTGTNNNTESSVLTFVGSHSGFRFGGTGTATSLRTARWVTNPDGELGINASYTQGEWTLAESVITGSTASGPSGITLNKDGVSSTPATDPDALKAHGNLLRIGAGNVTGGWTWGLTGDIAEILIYPSALGTGDLQTVSDYLNAKWFNGGYSSNFIPDTSPVTIAATASFDLNSRSETIGSLAGVTGATVSLGAGTLTTGGNGDHTTFAGSIAGTGGVIKTGIGTMTLSGANSYSGPTNVQAGKLVVNGSVTGTGAVTVASGATLGGAGSLAGAVAVQTGGVIAPNGLTSDTGTLNLGGTLTINGTAKFELGAAASDKIVVTGAADFNGGTLDVTALTVGGPTFTNGQVFDLFDYASYTNPFTTINLPLLTGGLQWKSFGAQQFDYTNGQIVVESTVVTPAIRTWDGGSSGPGDNLWSTAANWGTSGVPVNNTPKNELVFGGSTRLANNNDIASLSVGKLTFASGAGGFDLQGTALEIAGKIDNQAATAQKISLDVTFAAGTDSATLNVQQAAGSLELAGAVNSTLGLTKTGLGTAKLSALTGSTYSGPTLVNEGTLEVTKGINLVADTDDTTVGTSITTATLITEHIRQDVLTINAGSKVKISATGGAASTSVVNVLNIANASGSFSWSVPGGDISPAATGGPVASGAAVPEPATWLLAVIAALAGLVAWRRRK